jgi:predicted MPP superfamily phosphohydrolase
MSFPQRRGWLRHVTTLLRPHPLRRRRAWTRWVGRNWARVSYGRTIEPTWLELTRHEIAIADLPADFQGLRIVHLSDFHGGPGVPLAYLQEAVELANHQAPDLIALTGDFIHKGYRYVDRVAEIVGRLTAPLGVFAVLGNHDFSVRNALGIRRHRALHQAVEQALQQRGIEVLRNRSLRLERNGSCLHLVGVDDLWCRGCDLSTAFADLAVNAPCVLLAHNPITVEHIADRRCDLVLSGHTHGGQINWPGVGRFLLGPKGRRYAAGLYRYQDSHLYVNRGIGYGFRFRFQVRPEIAVLHLHRAPVHLEGPAT